MIRRVLRSRWLLTGIGVASAGLMVCMFAPLVGALGGIMPRAIAVVLMISVWAVANGAIDQVRRRNDQALAKGVGQPGTDAAAGEEVAELRDQLDRAMTLLRTAHGTRGYLYEQPWYVIIGPPGAGKTMALANAGLRFPLAEELGRGEIQGVGGTRLCDWSFTDAAVLIDTAGRYTTHDANTATDRAGWEGFLDLLRRTRSQQPLNGVIVAIGLDEIATATEEERQAHARAVRSRIKELNTRLGVRLPVYAMFTKADMIQGFVDFFSDLDRIGRAQVWGTTFPLGDGAAARFRDEFRALVAQLSARLVDRLQGERSLERRAAILAFPAQVASLEAPLGAFIDAAFGGTRLDPAPFLRGVYFGSATQQGNAIDRLTHSLAGDFGIDQVRVQVGAGRGRGYFLENLFKQVVFGEAVLVSHNPAAMRRRFIMRAAAWGCAGVFLLGGSAAVAWATWRSHAVASGYAVASMKYKEKYRSVTAEQAIEPVPLAGADVMQILPLLDRARDVVAVADQDHAGLGLSQQAKLDQAARQLYGRTLDYLLRPRLVSLMEARMRAHQNDTAYLYHTALPYKMLCCHLTMDAGALHAWLADDLRRNFAGASLAEDRKDLLAHADVLFAHGPADFPPLMDEVSSDTALLSMAEARMGHMGVGDVAYAQIRAQALPADLQDFVPERAAGGAMARSRFVRKSGTALDVPISALFTPAGFKRVLLARLPAAVTRAMGESAVRGADAAMDPNDPVKRQQVEREVIHVYTDEYIAAWQDLLDDLEVVPPRNSGSAIGDFSVLTSATGPIARLLGAVVSETALVSPAKAEAENGDAPPEDQGLSGAAVDRHFDDLRTYVASGELVAHLQTLGRVETQIEDTLGNSVAGEPPPPPNGSASRELSSVAEGAPEPAHRWLAALAARGQSVQSTTQRAATADAFSGQGGAQAQCKRVTGAFPFRAHATAEAPLEDFAALFGQNGTLDSFFTQYLRPYVTTGAGPWRVHQAGGLLPPIDAAAALSFQNAAMIRDSFFALGGTTPQVRFALRPVSFDSGTKKVTVTIDGVEKVYLPQGSDAIEPMEWPGPGGVGNARIAFDPPGDGAPLDQSGVWAFFRLLRAADMEPTGSERVLRVVFEQGERRAVFDLTTESLRNPFRASLLDHFSCPSLQP